MQIVRWAGLGARTMEQTTKGKKDFESVDGRMGDSDWISLLEEKRREI